MNTFYKCIIENNAFEEILTYLFDKKKILIIKDNPNISDELSEIVYILNRYHLILEDNDIFHFNLKLNSIEFNKNIEKLKVIQRKIKNDSNKILDTFNTFSLKNNSLYSLNDLYNKTISNIEFKDEKFEFYNIINKSNLFEDNDTDSIITSTTNLLKDNLIDTFIKYKKYENSSRFKSLNSKIDEKTIHSAITKLSSILNNSYAFIPPIFFNEYTTDFINKSIYYKNYDMETLKDIAKEVNSKHNSHLLNKINTHSKFNFRYLFNRKKVKIEKLKLLNEYKEKEECIYNQYMENIDNLNLYVNSFSFIKEIFNEDIFDNIKKYILQDDELQSYIAELKNLLVAYDNYLKIEQKVSSISKLELSILEDFYKYYPNKDSLKKLISFIPEFFFYKSIYEIELKNSKILNNYNNINNYLNSLDYGIKSFKTLLMNTFSLLVPKPLYSNIISNKITRNLPIKISKIHPINNIKKIINIIHPIYILKEEPVINNKKNYSTNFDLILKDSNIKSFIPKDANNNLNISNNKILNEIIKLLKPFNYLITINNNLIEIKQNSNESKSIIIYINPINSFTKNDLINLLTLRSACSNIIFIWSRDWWINKNDELIKIQNALLTLA